MLTPRTRDGWTLLIVAVLLASTIVTAALAAALTTLLFSNGFLVDVPAPRAGLATLPRNEPPTASASALGWRASVSCSVTVDDIGGKERPQ